MTNNLPAEARIDLALGAQFRTIQYLQDNVAELKTQLDDVTGRLTKRDVEFAEQVVKVTNENVHLTAEVEALRKGDKPA